MSERRRIQIIFRKADSARFLSHLDLISTLEFALRRARLPVALSEGFNPRPRLSLAAPLAVGHLGENELMEVILTEPFRPADVADRLQAALPPGITILRSDEVPLEGKPAAARLHTAVYGIDLPAPLADLEDRIANLLSMEQLVIDETHNGKLRRRDVRPLILSLDSVRTDEIVLEAAIGAGSVRPEQVLALLEIPTDGVRITRRQIKLTE